MTSRNTVDYGRQRNYWAFGAITFAAVMMMLAGVFQVLAGLVALGTNEVYATTEKYVFQFDTTAWGWIHIVIGVVVGLAGFGVLRANLAARIVGISLAALGAVANFMFIPYQPFWSLAIVALNVFVIWALAAHADEVRG